MVRQSYKSYKIGNTTILIVPPKISNEEKNKRLKEITQFIWMLWLQLHQNQKS